MFRGPLFTVTTAARLAGGIVALSGLKPPKVKDTSIANLVGCFSSQLSFLRSATPVTCRYHPGVKVVKRLYQTPLDIRHIWAHYLSRKCCSLNVFNIFQQQITIIFMYSTKRVLASFDSIHTLPHVNGNWKEHFVLLSSDFSSGNIFFISSELML